MRSEESPTTRQSATAANIWSAQNPCTLQDASDCHETTITCSGDSKNMECATIAAADYDIEKKCYTRQDSRENNNNSSNSTPVKLLLK